MHPERKHSLAEILTDLPAVYLRRLFDLPKDARIWSQPDAVRDSSTRRDRSRVPASSRKSTHVAASLLAVIFLVSAPPLGTSHGQAKFSKTPLRSSHDILARANAHFSGQFRKAWCGGGPCDLTLSDGTPLVAGKFYSVAGARVSGRRVRLWIITEHGHRDYLDYSPACNGPFGIFCQKVTPARVIRTVKHWDHDRHRAAPYEPGDFATALFRASLRALGHPAGFAAVFLLALALFFFDRTGGAVLGTLAIPVGPIALGAVLVLFFFAGGEVIEQDEQFREINAYLDTRRVKQSPSYFYPLDYDPDVYYSGLYVLAGLIFILLFALVPLYIYLRWAEIVHGFYFYVVPDPRKKVIETAIDGDLSLKGKIGRPPRRRWFANPAVMAAMAHRLTEKLRADEQQHRAKAKHMERETELLRAALRRERARHARKFLNSRGGDHDQES